MANILLIDDDNIVRKTLLRSLKLKGHNVYDTESAAKGFALFKANSIDIIITDLVMPDKDGLELIMQLRNELHDIPIIAISGGGRYGSDDYLESAQMFGADRILSKPFSLKTLLETVNELVSGAHKTDESSQQ